ncbi:MAG: hypothetical protein VX185_00165 [Pseudomonadota bacterium]|nr:hypothetical protein [Pseudomonadota bacterium]
MRSNLSLRDIAGIGLIEILVCIGISGIVMGSAMYFYINSFKENHYINQVHVAKNYINEIADLDEVILLYEETFKLNLDSDANLNENYCNNYCPLKQFYSSFLYQWHKRMDTDLAGAKFSLLFNELNEGTLSIAWQNMNYDGEGKQDCLIDDLPDGYVCYTANIR